MTKHVCLLCLAGFLAGPVAMSQTPVPSGASFQVNTYTTDRQIRPSVGVSDDGDFLVSWQSVGSSGADSDQFSAQSQSYAADGAAVGGEFQVNEIDYLDQAEVDVTDQPNDHFVIVWSSYISPFSRSRLQPKGMIATRNIFARQMDANGAPVGGEFQVDAGTHSQQYDPAVDAAATSSFVVVWDAYATDEFDIFGQRFDASGTPVGGEFQVNSVTAGYQAYSDVGVAEDGSFVVAWQSDASPGTDSDGYAVVARRFAADGTPQGADFQVNTFTTSLQVEVAIDSAPDGRFVVVGTSGGSPGTDIDDTSIQAQIYEASGLPVGAQFQVNTETIGTQILPDVAIAPDGRFAVVWTSGVSGGPPTSPVTERRRNRGKANGAPSKGFTSSNIFGQLFDTDGSLLGTEFQIDEAMAFLQDSPRIDMDAGGDFVVSWSGEFLDGTDIGSPSVRARAFRTTGDLGDRVWMDDNSNGIQDPLEMGFDGVTVHLYRDGEAMPTDSTTTVGGDFFFPQVPAGDWILEVEAPAGYGFTSQGSGSDGTVDSDVNAVTGRTAVITLDPADTDRDLDAGLVRIETNLSIDKTANPTAYLAGANLVYTLTARNNGPDPATGLIVTDALPPEVTWVSDTCGAGPPSGGTLTWTIGAADILALVDCEITVQVGAGVTGNFDNTATITGNEFDPNLASNTSTVTVSPASADLDITKTLDRTGEPFSVGDTITWTLEVSNAGPDRAVNIVVTDALPPEVTWVGGTCPGPPSDTLVWNIFQLDPGLIDTCQIEARIIAEGMISNTAMATSDTPDPNTTNNAGTAAFTAGPGTTVPDIPTLGSSALAVLAAFLGLAAVRRIRQHD